MDMDFKRPKKPASKSRDAKQLPGFRASSELPEHAEPDAANQDVAEDAIVAAFSDPIENEVTNLDSPSVENLGSPRPQLSEAAPSLIPISAAPTKSESESDPTDLTLDREKASATKIEEPEVQTKTKLKKSSKKQTLVLLIILIIVALGGGGWYGYQYWQENKASNSSQNQNTNSLNQAKQEVVPTTAPSPLTGREVSLELSARPVTGIMIENGIAARPQSGIIDADMVVEAIAEGGITRFLALYQESQPAHIGPIRSARPYYVDIARTFDAAYVHAGGSPDALSRISELGIKDMSAFEENGTYERVAYRDAPHDLYSSMAKIDARRTELGYTTSTFTPWKHKNDTPQTPLAATVNFSISGQLYNPTFVYDPLTNSYNRSQNGEAHVDEKSSKQISPKVVIALITSLTYEGQYSVYRTTGSGEIMVFQDGIVSTGTWAKDSPSSQFVFKDKNGLEFNFNKGQVWMTLLDSTGDVTHSP